MEVHRRLANLGAKTLLYEKGAEKHETDFNYTLDDSATQLVNIFEGLARQTTDLSDLVRTMRYDHLGVNDVLLQIERDYNNKLLPEPERLLPTLDQLAADEKFIDIARNRARALATRIRSGRINLQPRPRDPPAPSSLFAACNLQQTVPSYNLTLLITSVYSPCRLRTPKPGTQVNETMRPQPARFLRILLFFAFFSLLLPFNAAAQTAPAPSRITQAVDEANLTVLKGNTYYLARAKYDRGAAPSSLPMNRMLLVLQRSPQQESALELLLDQQQDQSSPNYHQWLTPQQFGQQFGPSDQDIQKITSWLQSHGFQVAPISNGRTVIEFSGTAGQVQEAFHTAIHKYSVPTKSGALEDHWANPVDPSIPAALAPVVVGIDTLHNFPAQGHACRSAAPSRKIQKTGEHQAHQSLPIPPLPVVEPIIGCSQQTCYFLGPYDFAAIYNVLPALEWLPRARLTAPARPSPSLARSDVDFKDIEGFHNMFGLPTKDPVLVLDGPDPGAVARR